MMPELFEVTKACSDDAPHKPQGAQGAGCAYQTPDCCPLNLEGHGKMTSDPDWVVSVLN